jgi:glycosyltransferase involved in cell wall biosynthesis
VLAASQRLHIQAAVTHPQALLCPNGVDYEHFARGRLGRHEGAPDDLKPLVENERPLIGYYGALARWFDFDLLHQVAENHPEWIFVLLGPDHDGAVSSGELRQRTNLHWLGPKPYADLPFYLRCFDVGIIPFKLNEITHSASPVKLYEYMAAGKPVVITPMEESLRCPGVLAGDGPEAFAGQIERGLALRTDPDYQELLDRTARENTWDVRADQVLGALNDKFDPGERLV